MLAMLAAAGNAARPLALGVGLVALPSPALAAQECVQPPADLAALVPVDATMALGVDVDGVVATDLWRELEPALHADLRLGDGLRILDTCGVDLARIYQVVAARGPAGEQLVALQGRAIGQPDTLECLTLQLAARSDGLRPWTFGKRECLDTLELADGTIFVVNAYTLVLARGAWVSKVQARLRGLDSSTVALLENTLAASNRARAQAWMVATLGRDEASALPGNWADEIEQLGVVLDLGAGIDLAVVSRSATVAAAASTREQIIAGLRNLAATLASRGAPLDFAHNPRVAVADRRVITRVVLTRAELLGLREALAGQIRGRGLF